jgi:hypothetical protein
MPETMDDARNLFLMYFAKYYEAKAADQPKLIWLYAVYCRMQLRKLASVPHNEPKDESDIVRDLFAGILNAQEAFEIFRDLCNHSS